MPRNRGGTGLDEGDVARFFSCSAHESRHLLLAGREPVAQGTDKVNAIINCQLATGRDRRPGMGRFSLTGQPNAMGGASRRARQPACRAHGILRRTTSIACGGFLERAAHGRAVMASRPCRMFEAIERGEIKALWVWRQSCDGPLPRALAPCARR
jgi:assimilatory nitrate reductase catalytic subunit